MESILQANRKCYICGRSNGALHVHHVFEGTANRAVSDRYGLTVFVCPNCHRAIHENPKALEWLKREAQEKAMIEYDWSADQFRKRFGKNYL